MSSRRRAGGGPLPPPAVKRNRLFMTASHSLYPLDVETHGAV
jgi:hypothetical protein